LNRFEKDVATDTQIDIVNCPKSITIIHETQILNVLLENLKVPFNSFGKKKKWKKEQKDRDQLSETYQLDCQLVHRSKIQSYATP
jgi:hypothetical protein